MILANF